MVVQAPPPWPLGRSGSQLATVLLLVHCRVGVNVGVMSEQHPMSGLADTDPDPDCQVGPSHAGGPRRISVLRSGDKVDSAQVASSRLRPRAGSKSSSSRLLRAPESGGLNATLPAMRVTSFHLALRASSQILLASSEACSGVSGCRADAGRVCAAPTGWRQPLLVSCRRCASRRTTEYGSAIPLVTPTMNSRSRGVRCPPLTRPFRTSGTVAVIREEGRPGDHCRVLNRRDARKVS
jgi:hypothetical protein